MPALQLGLGSQLALPHPEEQAFLAKGKQSHSNQAVGTLQGSTQGPLALQTAYSRAGPWEGWF